MKVIPGIGIDIVKFGITEEEVISQLGTPNKIYTTDEGCRRLQYNDLKIELSFEPENGYRLGWIEVHNSNMELEGTRIFGLSEEQAIPDVSDSLGEVPSVEDYGSFVSAFYEGNWVELQFQFGSLCCVNVGVLYSESGDPEWPSS